MPITHGFDANHAEAAPRSEAPRLEPTVFIGACEAEPAGE
jgi:hypothetical protein